jgi:hypothetical protein
MTNYRLLFHSSHLNKGPSVIIALENGRLVFIGLLLLSKNFSCNFHNRLGEASCDPCDEDNRPVDSTAIYNGKTAEVLKGISSPRIISVSRSRMRAMCSEGLSAQHNKPRTTLTYSAGSRGATTHLTDDAIAERDTLIGADGPPSAVREQVIGPQLVKLITL